MSLVMLYRCITLGKVSSTPAAMETITQFYNAVMKKGFFFYPVHAVHCHTKPVIGPFLVKDEYRSVNSLWILLIFCQNPNSVGGFADVFKMSNINDNPDSLCLTMHLENEIQCILKGMLVTLLWGQIILK